MAKRQPKIDWDDTQFKPEPLADGRNRQQPDGEWTVEKTTTLVREYELLTPLFGGGVKSGEADPLTVVRPSAIRGHLRFWWRATRGGMFGGDLAKMKAREDALWGAPSTPKRSAPSRVEIAVLRATDQGKDFPFKVIEKKGQLQAESNDQSSVPAYAAFPLQPTRDELKAGKRTTRPVLTGVKFTLSLTFPADAANTADVEAALWAWETFGGIGARTRRGFGAIRCLSSNGQAIEPPRMREVSDWIRVQLKHHVARAKNWPDNLPHIDEARLPVITHRAAQQTKTPTEVWNALIDELRLFRQDRETIDKQGKKVPKQQGFSSWPEPNAIRKLKGEEVKNDRTVADASFPRGQFGLPVEFHFPQEKLGDFSLTGYQKQGEDDKNPAYNRLASRLILRPLACREGAVGLAVVLKGPKEPPGGVWLIERPRGTVHEKVSIDTRDPRSIFMLDNEPDVLTAFLILLEKDLP